MTASWRLQLGSNLHPVWPASNVSERAGSRECSLWSSVSASQPTRQVLQSRTGISQNRILPDARPDGKISLRWDHPMPYCSTCGQPVQEAVRFCSSCGAVLSGAPPTPVTPEGAATPGPLKPAIVVKPQRGGLLALKAFLLFVVVAAIFLAPSPATTHGRMIRDTGRAIGYGIGAAYIITNLRKWKRQNQPVKGAGIGWTVAVAFLLAGSGALISVAVMNVPTESKTGTAPPSQANSTPSAPTPGQTGSKQAAPQPQAAPAEGNCGTGKTCRVRSNTGGDSVFVFVSEDALKEVKATSSMDATRQEVTALVFAGQVYMVPNGTTVTVLDWSVWHGWHKVRIVSARPHIGEVGYILDQWTTFE